MATAYLPHDLSHPGPRFREEDPPRLPDASEPQRPCHQLPIGGASVVVENELFSVEAKSSGHFPPDIGWIQCGHEVMRDGMSPGVYDIGAKIGIVASDCGAIVGEG